MGANQNSYLEAGRIGFSQESILQLRRNHGGHFGGVPVNLAGHQGVPGKDEEWSGRGIPDSSMAEPVRRRP